MLGPRLRSGHWTAYLPSLGADATGIDLVPDFIEHAQARYPGPRFRLGSMTDVDVPAYSVSGILSWYSTIHLSSSSRRTDDLTFDKTDEKGVVLIARLTAQLRCYVPEPVDEQYARLRHLGTRRDQLIVDTTGQQQIRDLLERSVRSAAAAAANRGGVNDIYRRSSPPRVIRLHVRPCTVT